MNPFRINILLILSIAYPDVTELFHFILSSLCLAGSLSQPGQYLFILSSHSQFGLSVVLVALSLANEVSCDIQRPVAVSVTLIHFPNAFSRGLAFA